MMNAHPIIDTAELGRRIARRRLNLGLEQDEVAAESGLSRPYISRLERGIVPSPKLQDLAQVARALDLPLSLLVDPPTTAREVKFDEAHVALDQLECESGGDPELAEDIIELLRISKRLRGRGGAD